MKVIYVVALAVLLCCHVLLAQSRGARQGNNKGKNSAKRNKPPARMASQGVPTHATDITDVKPIVMSGLFADQESAGDPSVVTQTPLLKPSKEKGGKTKGGKNKGGILKPMKVNEEGGAKSKNKGKQKARKPNGNNNKSGKEKGN